MWIITVNRKLNSLNNVQETNLKQNKTVISLCDMLRNFYENMLLRKLHELCELWKQVLKIVFETPKLVNLISLIDFEKYLI